MHLRSWGFASTDARVPLFKLKALKKFRVLTCSGDRFEPVARKMLWRVSIPRPEKLSCHHDGECRNAPPLRRAGHDYKFKALIAKRNLGVIQSHAKTALGTRHFGASHCAWPENLGRRVALLVRFISELRES